MTIVETDVNSGLLSDPIAKIRFLETLDRIHISLNNPPDFETGVRLLLTELLDFFKCDGARFYYPDGRWISLSGNDPAAPRPEKAEIPGAANVLALPCKPEGRESCRVELEYQSPDQTWSGWRKEALAEILRRVAPSIDRIASFQSLLEKEERYCMVFENSPVSIWEEDFSQVRAFFDRLRNEGVINIEEYFDQHPHDLAECASGIKIIDVNRAALTMHGASSKQQLMSNLTACFAKESYECFRNELVGLWNGKREMAIEGVVRTLSGELRNAMVFFSVCPGCEESLERVLVSLTDVTERKNLEQRLQQSQKLEALGQLAGGVAHDFNNMLSVIIGYANMAMADMGELDNSELYEELEQIRTAGLRSAEITGQLLAFARKQSNLPGVMNLNDAVTGMLKLLYHTIGENIELTWTPAEDLWPVMMDSSQIDQILANLCVNARDAIAGVGRITIETANVMCPRSQDDSSPETGFRTAAGGEIPHGDYVMLSLGDNGCGIDFEIQDRIFEPFFTTKEEGQGTGLGLATVYGIVKQNKGYIRVISESDQGTTFQILLPRHVAGADLGEELSAKEKEEPSGGMTGGSETILVIEDDDMVLELTRQVLDSLGYATLGASSPEEALELLSRTREPIDLFLSDVIMPQMSGLELMKKVRERHPEARSLFMSGYSGSSMEHSGIGKIDCPLMRKPFSAEILAATVREVLDSRIHCVIPPAKSDER